MAGISETLFSPNAFHMKMQPLAENVNAVTPNIHVGKAGYPNVRIGFLSTKYYEDQDKPLLWKRNNLAIQDILQRRNSLLNAYKISSINLPNHITGEITQSIKALETEITTTDKPQLRLRPDDISIPYGPSAELKSIKITSNAKIPASIQKVHSDNDLGAVEGIKTLWKVGHDEHKITSLLSAGQLGVTTQRKHVPTRWSITAVDDSLGKSILSEVQNYNHHQHALFQGNYLGNHYIILFLPQQWSFELYEMSQQNPTLEFHDLESTFGRTTYATKTAGGYYACRLAILENLQQQKRCAGVLAIRIITKEYWAPLGVWVVREATRNTMQATIQTYTCDKDLVNAATQALTHMNVGAECLEQSLLLTQRKTQRPLAEYL